MRVELSNFNLFSAHICDAIILRMRLEVAGEEESVVGNNSCDDHNLLEDILYKYKLLSDILLSSS